MSATIRVYLAILFALISFPWVGAWIYGWSGVTTYAEAIPWGEQSNLLVEKMLSTSQNLMTISVGLIAATWASFVFKSDNGNLLGTNESRTIFFCSSACCLFSALSHLWLVRLIGIELQNSSRAMLYGGNATIPDLTASQFLGYVFAQILGLFLGGICIVFVVTLKSPKVVVEKSP